MSHFLDKAGSVVVGRGKNGNELRAHYDKVSDTITLIRWMGDAPIEILQCFGREDFQALVGAMPSRPRDRKPDRRRRAA